MHLVLALLLLLAPAPPAAGITVQATGSTSGPLRADVTVWLLNSDPRYQEFAVSVAVPSADYAVQLPVYAPASELREITLTIPLSDAPPICGSSKVFDLIVSGEAITDSLIVPFSYTQVGGVASIICSPRMFLPLIR